MFSKILSWLAGGVLNRVLKSIDNSIDNETERNKIRAHAVERFIEVEAETRQAKMQSPIFWYVWAGFAAPLGLWFGAICLDSVFLFSGNIADLPASVKPYANQIFGAIFGSGAAVGSLQAIASAIRGRR